MVQKLYVDGADPYIEDKEGKTPLTLAREFPDEVISKKLVSVLSKRRIPLLHTGAHSGRDKCLTLFFAFMMAFLNLGYLGLLKVSLKANSPEWIWITSVSALNLITYILACRRKPESQP